MEDSYMSYRKLLVVPGLFLLFSILITACEAPQQPTYSSSRPDPNPSGKGPAVLTAMDPAEGYLKDIVTISGTGFNPEPEFNFVAFGTLTGEVISATSTQLQVRTPNISDDTVVVKVAVKGSEFWSNVMPFRFKNTKQVIADDIAWPNGVDVDDNENIYIGSAVDSVIYKITPDGERSVFANVAVSGSIRFGPNGFLYVCSKGEGKIVRISPDGATIQDVVEVADPVYFDWDSGKNMWVISNGVGLYKFDTGQNLVQADTMASAKSLRVFGNNLYVTNIWKAQIVKYDITGDGLANRQVILEPDSPAGIEFDKEGTMYYTPAWETSLYTLHSDGTEEILFEGELLTPMRYLTFNGKYMYIVFPGGGDIGTVMRVYLGVEQAPSFGRMES
jgi:sugar lactone lactonase YvrE